MFADRLAGALHGHGDSVTTVARVVMHSLWLVTDCPRVLLCHFLWVVHSSPGQVLAGCGTSANELPWIKTHAFREPPDGSLRPKVSSVVWLVVGIGDHLRVATATVTLVTVTLHLRHP